MSNRAWAMRTSRDSESDRKFIAAEFGDGKLRQGWGEDPSQDLRQIKIRESVVGYAGLTDLEKAAWGHWRMLGEASSNPDDAMEIGDIVLVPNVPVDGFFVLCRVAGPYSFDIPPGMMDFGHLRPVEVLTPGGVSYTHDLVSGDLRRSLRCRSRLWWVGDHAASIDAIIARVSLGHADDLRKGADHLTRATRSIARPVEEALKLLTAALDKPLRDNLQAAEWEPVLASALGALLREIEVKHTGGPSEKGADLEIHIPNPFEPDRPWVIAIQVKDYDGEISADAADQIEQAIQTRLGPSRHSGGLVAVLLASTRAGPSPELEDRLDELSRKYVVQVSCVHGKNVMRALAQGLFIRSWGSPAAL